MTYEVWKRLVNEHVIRISGIDCDGLPDYDYQRAFNQKRQPLAVAKDVIRKSKGY